MTEQRLIEIETKISHQEFLIEKLNRIVSQQEVTIYQLEETLAGLAKHLKQTTSNGLEGAVANEKPPHY